MLMAVVRGVEDLASVCWQEDNTCFFAIKIPQKCRNSKEEAIHFSTHSKSKPGRMVVLRRKKDL
jgi:hypothetical protein